mmetsp:Transcript_20499/g.50163  ORF Transcript_20499/g.50163 Transcript_20499/m.50163 type:complete len:112 (-) Transcript_20499:564-899(-)
MSPFVVTARCGLAGSGVRALAALSRLCALVARRSDIVCLCERIPSANVNRAADGDVGLEFGRFLGADGSIVRALRLLPLLRRRDGPEQDALRCVTAASASPTREAVPDDDC